MDLINQIYLKTAAGWHILNIIQQFAHVIDASTRGGIDFDEIHTPALGNFLAGSTLTTRCSSHPGLTIQTLGQNPGNSRFANTASTRKQVSVMQPVIFQRIDQCAQNMFLTFQLCKG